ncbi:myb/SANT-like DNA-binding domain-containing protein 1 [Haematobia irritans]|uniref:myb/SANT-like DNA-binding domain-containing protein 1 n=1 Tax=Haematobia irritans TaxID=7368 RepID=UPI003F502849
MWEEYIDDLRGTRKNSHVYQEMAKKLEDVGFKGAWTDVRTKLDNLTRKYSEKGKIGSTGGEPSNWQHYHKVHNILGSFKIHNVEQLQFMGPSPNCLKLIYVVSFD